jgi:lysyl-tRNA synthetase class 2
MDATHRNRPISRLEEQRLAKLQKVREAGIDPYPTHTTRTHTIAEALALPEESAVTVVGRLVSLRDMGKTVFAHIEDGSGRVQLFLRREEVGEESHTILRKLIDLGDFVQATGTLFLTRSGEMSVRTSDWRLLSKAIAPLPAGKEQEVEGELVRYSAFADVEERYRQRYADLAVNPDVRELFIKRSRIVTTLRHFMDTHGFLEVETPILQPVYGGAAAKPFTTHHNQLHQDLYLRISFELYLKRLLVGGLERVYEIGRDFRNEGVSYKHNPEFTQLEFYAAYWDYGQVAAFTEQMMRHVAQAVNGTTQITFGEHTFDVGQPWRRLTMREAIRQYSEIDYMDHLSADSLRTAMRAIGADAPPQAAWGQLIDTLFGTYVEPRLIDPTFIFDYPRDISPLAKRKPGDDFHVERFEFFLGGMEMGNAFTELNDPLDQEQRFVEMQTLYSAGSDEAHPIDEDYLRAMRYGMPPNGGFGMGIDRLTMLLTNRQTIREVLLFPHLRSNA